MEVYVYGLITLLALGIFLVFFVYSWWFAPSGYNAERRVFDHLLKTSRREDLNSSYNENDTLLDNNKC